MTKLFHEVQSCGDNLGLCSKNREEWLYCLNHRDWMLSTKSGLCSICDSSELRQMYECMAIQINDEQTVEQILLELKRLGYAVESYHQFELDTYLHTSLNGTIDGFMSNCVSIYDKQTTLSDLKSKPSHADVFLGARYQTSFDKTLESYSESGKSEQKFNEKVGMFIFIIIALNFVLWFFYTQRG